MARTAKQIIDDMLVDVKSITPSMNEAYFSDELFNLYYELKEQLGDERIITELMRNIPEKVIKPVMKKLHQQYVIGISEE